jgi:hypothetical protein
MLGPPQVLRTPLLHWAIWLAVIPQSPLLPWILHLRPLGCCLSPDFLDAVPSWRLACPVLRTVNIDEVPTICLHAPSLRSPAHAPAVNLA